MTKSNHPADALRRAHMTVGLLAIVIFLLTGQYMDRVQLHLIGMPDGPRLFYRSAHIYLLWSGLANTLLGCYLVRIRGGACRQLQMASSAVLLVVPALFAYSFFCETYNPALARPIAWWGNLLSFFGAIIHMSTVLIHRRVDAASIA